MTNGSSRPYSQSVGVRCKLNWKISSWLAVAFSDWFGVSVIFDTSCNSRDDPRLKEYSMMFPNKLNPQEFLLCAMKKYWCVHLSWNTRRPPSIFLCFNTAISNSTRSTEKNRFFARKADSYSPVSSKSARSRQYCIATSARSRHYNLASDHTIHRAFKRALSKKMNVVDDVRL